MTSTYEKIATSTLGSNSATIEFTSISSAYTDLVVIGSLKVSTTNNPACYLQFNGDTASNYSTTILWGNGTTTGSTRLSSQTFIRYNYTADPNTTDFGTVLININNYSNTTTYKTVLTKWGLAPRGLDTSVGLWRNTAAINKVTFTLESPANFTTGCVWTLYGIKAE
jgi:hypothetical protein